MVSVTEDQANVQRALDNHEDLRHSYFWSNHGNASARRYREKQLNFTVAVEHGGHLYQYTSSVQISAKNFYYYGRFSQDGQRGTVRIFKKLAAILMQGRRE